MPRGLTSCCTSRGSIPLPPSGRAMYQMLGVFAEFEWVMIRERVMAGLARAKADGVRLGRRTIEDADAKRVMTIRTMLCEGVGVRRIARDLRVGVGTVLRIRDCKATRGATE